jgi:hypothetical protein
MIMDHFKYLHAYFSDNHSKCRNFTVIKFLARKQSHFREIYLQSKNRLNSVVYRGIKCTLTRLNSPRLASYYFTTRIISDGPDEMNLDGLPTAVLSCAHHQP